MLITSLAPDQASPHQLGALYRLRWQIELAFKRLRACCTSTGYRQGQGLARAWVFAHLIAPAR